MGLLLLGLWLPVGCRAEPIRLASWNLFNLHHENGVPLRRGAPARSERDYQVLRAVQERVAADVVALQEVNGPRAARRVFPEPEWELFFSGRLEEDRRSGRRSDRIYTGFAVRRDVFDAVEKRDVPSLGVAVGRARSRPTRWGTELRVERGGSALRLLVVHLKSGCHSGSLEPPRGEACDALSRQRAPLEAWIDARAREGEPFVVLGDFNRRLDRHGARDHLWAEIDDGSPEGLALWRVPFRRSSDCWRGTPRHHEDPIDFLVFDARAWERVERDSFREWDYRPAEREVASGLPSDHCPISVDVRL